MAESPTKLSEVAAPKNVGEAETQPGQVEVVAGTVEHVQVLQSYPNASSYGPDVNVVLPPVEPPPPPPDPPETLSGGVYRDESRPASKK